MTLIEILMDFFLFYLFSRNNLRFLTVLEPTQDD